MSFFLGVLLRLVSRACKFVCVCWVVASVFCVFVCVFFNFFLIDVTFEKYDKTRPRVFP